MFAGVVFRRERRGRVDPGFRFRVRSRRDRQILCEVSIHLTLIIKPYRGRSFTARASTSEEVARLRQANLGQVLVRGDTEGLSEATNQALLRREGSRQHEILQCY
jgi:hypothetical protein